MKRLVLFWLISFLACPAPAQDVEWVVEPTMNYDAVTYLENGLSIVNLNGKSGLLSTKGDLVTPLKYDEIKTIYKNYVYQVDMSGGFMQVRVNDKWGFVDITGREITPLKYDYIDAFYEGFAKVVLNRKISFIDTTGREITPFKYDYSSNFAEGVASVKNNDNMGFIDNKGNEIIPLKYNYAFDFSEGLASVQLNNKWVAIDKTGKEVITTKYDYISQFYEGLAYVCLNKKYGFINKIGNEITPIKYDFVDKFVNGLALVKLNGKEGFIDKKGKEVIPLKYDGLIDIGKYSISTKSREEYYYDGLFRLSINGKYGFVDKDGKEIIPIQYDWVSNFIDGLACIYLNKKYGFVDKLGKEIIPIQYDAVRFFSKELIVAELNKKYVIIDRKNYEIAPFPSEFDEFDVVPTSKQTFCEGLMWIRSKLNWKYGFIDNTGKVVISIKFDDVRNFSEGLALVKLDNKYGFIDKTGKEVIPLKYENASISSEGLMFVKLNGKWGIIRNPLLPKNNAKPIKTEETLPTNKTEPEKNVEKKVLPPTLTLQKVDESPFRHPQIETTKSEVHLHLAYSYAGNIQGVRIHNQSANIDLDNKIISTKTKVPLSVGKNSIKVSLRTDAHGVYEQTFIITRKEIVITHNIHVLSVGIDTFQDSTYNLQYSGKDAKDIANVFAQQKDKGIFEKVTVQTLVNKEATRLNILDALDALKHKAKEDDVAVLFFSSHGADFDKEFYLLAYDADASKPHTYVSFADIVIKLKALPCRVLFLADACHSGTLGENLIAHGSKDPQKGVERAVEILKTREKGAFVLLSSRSNEVSWEDSAWQNGAFAKAIVEGLAGKADIETPQDKVIYFSELATYVQKRVKELVKDKKGKQQTPIQKLIGEVTTLPIVVTE